ncbi:MAG: hypothetical protein DMF80_08480 [Acidobacteria bacterium]|nr:MAG: hypothetical protein DMF80_08480 [Acidobacteriota bacterium]
MEPIPPAAPARPHLTRGFGLLHATALNMANMVGVGPFITIPLLMAAMGGPQSLLGWWVGALIVLCDGQVWSELGAALPGSGGSYRFLREAYGPARWGRLMAFLFIWSFVLSGPLEIASGLIGFGQYAGYLWPGLASGGGRYVGAAAGLLAIVLLARRITFLSRLTVTLWVGTVATMLAVMADFPPGAFDFNRGFVLGLGSAALIAIYDYLGYYDICYIGDEVRDPARVIPRSILFSILGCAVGYFLLHLSLLGVIPWREMLNSKYVVSEFMERLHGRGAAVAVTLMILWTAFGSVFALLLGYSRIPFAAAVQGDFFKAFAHVHPTKQFPDVSLYVLGAVSIVASFFSLDQVITALITTRVIVQFVGQIIAVPLLRKRLPDDARPFKMWLYPVPAIVALAGWAYIFLTSGWGYVEVGLLTLAAGVATFLGRARLERAWPFAGATTLLLALAAPAGAADPAGLHQSLDAGWAIQSSGKVVVKGEAVSRVGFRTEAWHRAAVPSTVVGALVGDGTYPDPYFGMALRSLPGATYPIGKNFSNLPMPGDSPFRSSWWYRTEFALPASPPGRAFWLRFDGINYRANVWLNGERVAGSDEVAGAFRRYEFDVTRLAHPGTRNALAVEVFAPGPGDLGITWVDWNPAPPDKDMGLWAGVSISDSGPLALRHPQVLARLDLPSLDAAHLTVTAEVWNATDKEAVGTVRGVIGDVRFSRPVKLAPREKATVRFAPEQVPALNLSHPRLWWPYRMGAPELYTLALSVDADGSRSDRQEVRFGIQQIDSELTPEGHRLFKVNGKPILIRGGGWSPDMMLRWSRERLEAQFRYVKEMGLNTIRLEGKLEPDEFFDLADRDGILVMAGWCCCDHWEKWKDWDAEDRRVAVASLTDQARRLRNHPSLLVWLDGSDGPPPPDVEKAYLEVLAQQSWPKPIISSATDKPTSVSGASGVKMKGPYDYVPPSYWLTDHDSGGAFGFATEISPGAAVPPVESLRQMLPGDHLWPIDEVWAFHAGGGEFKDLKLFTGALEGRYGKATGVEDYARKAQALAYEGERAMFEGYARNKYVGTGVIQWMLNNAWPSMIWHLYDYYLRPGGGYFGTKKACEPLHVQYSYDDRSVAVVNDRPEAFRGVKVSARVLDLGLGSRFSRDAEVDVPPDGVVRAIVIPALADLTPTYFLRLGLADAEGRVVSTNFYWLSTRDDVLDWKNTKWYYTPTTTHADLTALATLPPTKLVVSSPAEPAGPEGSARVSVENAGRALAFQVRVKLIEGAGGREILPVYWEDNYFELLPGEKRVLHVSYPRGSGARPVVEAEAWNAPAATN